jgi:hypothetical protein
MECLVYRPPPTMLLEQLDYQLIVVTFPYIAFIEFELAPFEVKLDVVLFVHLLEKLLKDYRFRLYYELLRTKGIVHLCLGQVLSNFYLQLFCYILYCGYIKARTFLRRPSIICCPNQSKIAEIICLFNELINWMIQMSLSCVIIYFDSRWLLWLNLDASVWIDRLGVNFT